MIGCTGGGSNFGGIAFPFVRENIINGKKTRIIAVEPAAAPSLTRGVYAYDFGDTAADDAADEDVHPGPRLHARADPRRRAALPRHGAQVSALKEAGLIEAVNVQQNAIFEAAISSPAPKASCPRRSRRTPSGPPSRGLACRESGESKTIVFNLSGHGHFDLAAYDAYLPGKLEDYEYPARRFRTRCCDCRRLGRAAILASVVADIAEAISGQFAVVTTNGRRAIDIKESLSMDGNPSRATFHVVHSKWVDLFPVRPCA